MYYDVFNIITTNKKRMDKTLEKLVFITSEMFGERAFSLTSYPLSMSFDLLLSLYLKLRNDCPTSFKNALL